MSIMATTTQMYMKYITNCNYMKGVSIVMISRSNDSLHKVISYIIPFYIESGHS